MMEVGKWCQHKQQQVDNQASQGQSSNAQQQQQHGEDQKSEIRRILLRLDHMRARASYSKTIKQWAAQLNLTGDSICRPPCCDPYLLIAAYLVTQLTKSRGTAVSSHCHCLMPAVEPVECLLLTRCMLPSPLLLLLQDGCCSVRD